MAVLAALVAGAYFLVPAQRESANNGPKPVEYEVAAKSASRAAPFELLAPERTAGGWKATSVRYWPEDERWHLGFLTDGQHYAAVEQGVTAGPKQVGSFAEKHTQNAKQVGTRRIAGQTWTVWSGGEHGYRGLLRTSADASTAVVGTAPLDELTALAKSLRGKAD